jgi:simple sugar transport system ATP-binding protein
MDKNIVEMNGIKKTFGNVDALRGVNLYLKEGEVLGLVGDNAAGKSTLTKILAGAIEPTDGEIIVNDKRVSFKNPAEAKSKKIEMVYQDLALCNSIDVSGNIFLGREKTWEMLGLKFLKKKEMEKETKEILDDLSIKVKSVSSKVEFLSGGQRQSIAIGKAVASNPKVLIMDEPTSALAVAEVESVLNLINKVKSLKVSVILITHRLQDIFKVCDRIMVMYEGRNVAERKIEDTDLSEIVSLIVAEH